MPRRENHQTAALVREVFGGDTFTTAMAMAVGISESALATTCRAGLIRRERRGVYSSGEDDHARAKGEIERLRKLGIPAALGGRSAAAVWEVPVLGPYGALPPAPVTILVPHGTAVRQGTRSGVRMRLADLSESDVLCVDPVTMQRVHGGLYVTTPLRTGLDVVRDVGRSRASALVPLCGAMRAHIRLDVVADGASESEVTEAAREANVRREMSRRLARVASSVNSHGMRWYSKVLADAEPLVETALEGLAWAIVTDSSLPRPRPQEWVRGASGRRYRVDFVIGDRVILEADGAVKYAEQTPWREKQRQSDLEAAGYWVVRCTWAELIHRPHEVLARIALALKRAAA